MTHLFEIGHKDILRLDDEQLTQLLKKLLSLEVKRWNLQIQSFRVSLASNQKDGGEDGYIKWDHSSIKKTDYFPNKSILFQCKQRTDANGFTAAACKKELLNTDNKTVKERINSHFLDQGTYILFCNFPCNRSMQEDRIEGFRKGLRAAHAPYAESCAIQIYDGEKIADWTNQFPAAALYVCECIGRPVPCGALTWGEWEKYYCNRFFSDKYLQDIITGIRTNISGKQKVVRFVGNSGLGKTRVALEAFRPPELLSDEISPGDIVQSQLSADVVYFDNARDVENLISAIRNWRKSKLSGTIIVDECDCETHDRLAIEIKHSDSCLSLLSIDYTDTCGIREDPVYKLQPVSNDIIEKIVLEQFSGLPEPDVKRIVDFTQGYPEMAVLIAKNRTAGAESIGTITKEYLIDRLIGGREKPTDIQKDVIKACSLFTEFGVKDNLYIHADFIAKNICNISSDDFHRIIKQIKSERGIIEERGRYFRVTPMPLAITLATGWWKYCSPDQAEKLLFGNDIPEGLVNSLCNQFRYINIDPEIEELTKELCNNRRRLGKAETLNSERGSRIFRSIAEVNPREATDALYRCFGDADKELIKQIIPGRRNIVWALENLCFWENTFTKAANLLLKFAVSETEPGLGNNSTEQFYQLFHLALSGTQAPPNMRLKVIDEGLSTNDPEFQTICITALGHALQTHSFLRIGGVELQGSRYPKKDWIPKTRKEVFDYWDDVLRILKKYALNEDPIGKLAISQIEKSIWGMLEYRRLDILDDVIFSICKERGYFWPEVSAELNRFLHYHSEDIPEDAKIRLNNWINKLGPQSIIDEAYLKIISPKQYTPYDGSNHYEKVNTETIEFAKYLSSKPEDLREVLELLSRTPSSQGYQFGYALCNCTDDKDKIINTLIDLLKGVPKEEMDDSVLGGYLYALRSENSALVSQYLKRISEDPQLSHLLLVLTARTKPEKTDLDLLITQLKNDKLHIEDFREFQYRNALRHLYPASVLDFFNDLLLNSENGCIMVFELAFDYAYDDEIKTHMFRPFFKKLFIDYKCFSTMIKDTNSLQGTLYSVTNIISGLLQQSGPDLDIAKNLTEEIIALCSGNTVIVLIYEDLEEIIKLLLLPEYIETTWPIFGAAITSREYRGSDSLELILGSEASAGKWAPSPLESIQLPLITQWCEDEPDRAPIFLANAILPLINIDQKITWSPLAKYLINHYGDNEKVLAGLTNKISIFSWIGSKRPFYETWLNNFEALLTHLNPRVKRWAEINIESLRDNIRAAEREDEEKELYRG
ncbi:hypothetical protein Mlab_0974 [Methanocorpusculum labreanum Z]|uniref:Uncharacterized protein n=1 Tax=Methanocorpusculum labreanum (strain ATCC 43576 / DSM 4855 / Z) TaxID=410358 RepID=A2SS38_METLZ|nr:hypothetical protein [Methanocorpusculum labreanum]ABN07144.1 hypothetical protein Mlab_0974 [Methanocorpusculum labreanum Z]